MSEEKDLYMLFYRSGFWFGVPVLWVHRTAGALEHTELPVWDFVRAEGQKESGKEKKYHIYLEQGECSCCLGAEEVEGIWQRGTHTGCSLEAPVIREENLYLKEAVYEAGEEDREGRLIYLLDPVILYECLQRDGSITGQAEEKRIADEQKTGRAASDEAAAKAIESEETEAKVIESELAWEGGMAARAGGRSFFVEGKRVEVVLRRPLIWEVPGADDGLLGISFYEGKLVVYYHSADIEETHCGIILRINRDFFAGIAASEADAAAAGNVSGRFREMMPGVWEKIS